MEPVILSASLRVLVVDDCPDTTWSLALLLQTWGHDPIVAHDGPTALALAREFQPDVILLDLALPGMDGCEVASRLRSQENGDRLYLLSVSGYGREEDRHRALQAGCNDHWIKPVEPETLRHLLASLKRRDEG
jgi:CheY-like chemotaxis protein